MINITNSKINPVYLKDIFTFSIIKRDETAEKVESIVLDTQETITRFGFNPKQIDEMLLDLKERITLSTKGNEDYANKRGISDEQNSSFLLSAFFRKFSKFSLKIERHQIAQFSHEGLSRVIGVPGNWRCPCKRFDPDVSIPQEYLSKVTQYITILNCEIGNYEIAKHNQDFLPYHNALLNLEKILEEANKPLAALPTNCVIL